MSKNSAEKLVITYHVFCPDSKKLDAICQHIAVEQTVEVPLSIIKSRDLLEQFVGVILEVRPIEPPIYHVKIAYNPEITGYEIPQFINVLYGNISLRPDVKVVDFQIPEKLLNIFNGPRYGIEGLRNILGVYERPLAATALKPIGSSLKELAEIAGQFALGGGDIVKDDHNMVDQAFSPFKERILRIQQVVEQANRKTGRVLLYFPNVAAPFDQIEEKVEFSVRNGVQGILIAPFLVGLDTIRHLSQKYGVIIMSHPSFSGAHFHPNHGIAQEILLGTLFRLLGADISVFVNVGGRFSFTLEACQKLCKKLTEPLGPIKAAFPCPAGGMGLNHIDHMAQYGPDCLYLIGGDLLGHTQDLTKATQIFLQTIRNNFKETLIPPHPDTFSACEFPEIQAQKIKSVLKVKKNFQWSHRSVESYKTQDSKDFKGVSRQELIGKNGEKTLFDLRYFEIEPGGFTSFEKHVHEHVIIGVRGKGVLLRDHQIIEINPHDIAFLHPLEIHQLKNETQRPFGFFCIVDHQRDKPRPA